MKNYELKEDEVVLFKGMVCLLSDWKDKKECVYNTELLLTNYNVVLTTKIRKLISSIEEQRVYCIEDIKVYDQSVQVIRKKKMVDMYFLSAEVFLVFEKEKSAKEFCDKTIKLRDGNSKFVRSVKKAQKAIGETNEALDIDMVEIAKKTGALACDIVSGLGTVNGAGKTVKGVAKIAEIVQMGAKTRKKEKFLEQPTYNDTHEPTEEKS